MRADDAEDAAAKWVVEIGGMISRDDKAPGKPVIEVVLLTGNKKITNEGLKELKAFKNLKWLGVFGCEQISDEGMRHVKEVVSLERLALDHTSVTDAGFAELKDLKKLKSLSLTGSNKVTDKGTETIKGFADLEVLSLGGVVTEKGVTTGTITDKGVKNLVGLKKLTYLNLAEAKLTDAAVKDIADNMPQLQTLQLGVLLNTGGSEITDASVPHLARLTKLTMLGLAGSKITGDGVQALQKKLPKCTITPR
jgi:hypothetical protein